VFNSTTKYTWSIQGLENPEWGLDRPREDYYSWDFDANDARLYEVYEK
jgi:hypothetical protein